jgi:hypothetical protein
MSPVYSVTYVTGLHLSVSPQVYLGVFYCNFLDHQIKTAAFKGRRLYDIFLAETINQLLRAYPNNRVVMRPSEKDEAKAAGQNPHRRS